MAMHIDAQPVVGTTPSTIAVALALYEPPLHGWHTMLDVAVAAVLKKVPAAQVVDRAAHTRLTVEDGAVVWYCEFEQMACAAQAAEPVALLKLPAPQAVQPAFAVVGEPVKPAAQVMQSSPA